MLLPQCNATTNRRLGALLLAPLAALVFGCTPVSPEAADVNGDGWVDELDLELVQDCFGVASESPPCDATDLNGDGFVTMRDLLAAARHRGTQLFESPPEIDLSSYPSLLAKVDAAGVIYLCNEGHSRVERYSIPQERWLSPLAVGLDCRSMTFSEELQRLTLHDLQTSQLVRFDLAFRPIRSVVHDPLLDRPAQLVSAGEWLVVRLITAFGDPSSPDELVFDPSGIRSATVTGPPPFGYLTSWAWSPIAETALLISFAPGPRQIATMTIDPTTTIPRYDSTGFEVAGACPPFLTASANGRSVLASDGRIMDLSTTEVANAWMDWHDPVCSGAPSVSPRNDEFVSFDYSVAQAWRILDAGGAMAGPFEWEGLPIALVSWAGEAHLLSERDGEHVLLTVPHPAADDVDADGVPNQDDAFPSDPAASIDSDGDGWPDAWNSAWLRSGYDAPSPTFLQLDRFPDDPAAALDTDSDGAPDLWNPGMSEADSTTGLSLDPTPGIWAETWFDLRYSQGD